MTSSFFQTFPVFPRNPRTLRRYSRWFYIARQCTVIERLRRFHLPHRDRSRHALHHPGWIDSGRKKSQKGEAVRVFSQQRTWCTPIKIWKKFNTIWINPESRCTKILGEFNKKKVLFEARSEKRIAVLSHTIPRNCSSQHTTCDMYWESGLHEDWRGFMLQSFPKGYRESYSRQICNMDVGILFYPEATKSADHRSEQSAKYEETRRSDLGDTSQASRRKSAMEVQGKLSRSRWLQHSRYTSLNNSERRLESQGNRKKWFNSSRITRTVTRS